MTHRAVVALGTNLGDREQQLSAALEALCALPGTQVLRVSGVYETKPVGYTEQPRFLNAVTEIETALSPHALLGACLGIEAAMGRVRMFRNGPRVVDLDILVYDGVTCTEDELTLPHPRMGERAFVLVPLADLYPDGKVLSADFAYAMDDALRNMAAEGIVSRPDCHLEKSVALSQRT